MATRDTNLGNRTVVERAANNFELIGIAPLRADS